MLATIRTLTVGMLLGLLCATLHAQTFVRVTDPQNEAAVTPGQQGYRGCAWIDYDLDGDEDLWVNRNLLYRNDGGGVFVNAQVGIPAQTGLGSGSTWADYDNDGDPDLYIAESPNSALYRNDGDGQFTMIDEGDIGPSGHDYRGWSCAWGDYDADGYVDLIVTHPAGFLGNPSLPNFMFRNDGPPDYTFTRITEGPIVTGLGAYTVGSFADFDLDGDLDYNIGAGPVNVPGTDYFYRNTLRETGTAGFERWSGNLITDTPRDGQNINWIDFDNDRDLDCYVTNYTAGFNGGRRNDLYRNDDGTYTAVTEGAIVTDRQTSLGNCWADFDNDGFLDCVVANETGTNKYYHNLGAGTFASLITPFTGIGSYRCPSAADYDNDGDLDLFITAVGNVQGFFRNDTDNGHFWSKLKLVGTTSNRSAIGAVVEVKCLLGDESMWQIREINTQNSFNGHNSQLVHFGCRFAPMLDSVVIRWPSGLIETYTGLYVNQTYELIEGEASAVPPPILLPNAVSLTAFPNPFNSETVLHYKLPHAQTGRLEVFDLLGRTVRTYDDLVSEGTVGFTAHTLATGAYIARLTKPTGEPLATPLRLLYVR